ncbi:glycosyltransferase [Polynucleobacter sp. 30F-ANTBAC]|uniref:glycosyltransferase family 2 protein n=1 Tax=Polynucleobacter sp. 30F-ANTBAC TaxID=2689095 RepID=UPI001C0DA1FD|nr:glycosyltransferase [Polynucleobacter sp. 30F-ANTBAC]MBU3599657.1 glycosyltransferase [Polynucleobacter sp. 30F-ANTBAC]
MENNSVVLVSVLLPVYKCEKYLSACLNSIISQSLKSFEVLAVYDDSDDKTLEILTEYSNIDSRIKIIKGSNRGLIGALNDALDKANGIYLARMDSDDISIPDRFEKQVKLMESTSADVCGGHYFIIGSSDEYLGSRVVPCSDYSMLLALSLNVPFAHGSVMFRADFIDKHGIRYGASKYQSSEDYALWALIYSLGGKFCNVNDWIFKYREHEVSLSKTLLKEVRCDAYKISSEFIESNKTQILIAIQNFIGINRTREESENLATLIFIFSFIDLNFKLLPFVKELSKRDILTGFIRAVRFIYFKYFIK